jgi:Zinc-binding domain of primase-helicase
MVTLSYQRLDTEQIRSACRGRWVSILSRLGIIPADALDRRHHPCPICRGTDRFRAFDDVEATGGTICNRCGKHGDGFATIMWLERCDFPTALRRVADCIGMGGYGFSPAPAAYRPAPSPAKQEPMIASVDIRHAAYSRLLDSLTLSDDHHAALRKRCFTDEEIERNNYRSWRGGKLPIDAVGVPGHGADTMAGLLIPVRAIGGNVIALKIRIDHAEKNKYRYVTSSGCGGAKADCAVHIPLGVSPGCGILRITEGELKADVATALSGIATISIPGVGMWKKALPIVAALAPHTVRIAMDSDAATNQAVAAARDGLAAALHGGAN